MEAKLPLGSMGKGQGQGEAPTASGILIFNQLFCALFVAFFSDTASSEIQYLTFVPGTFIATFAGIFYFQTFSRFLEHTLK